MYMYATVVESALLESALLSALLVRTRVRTRVFPFRSGVFQHHIPSWAGRKKACSRRLCFQVSLCFTMQWIYAALPCNGSMRNGSMRVLCRVRDPV